MQIGAVGKRIGLSVDAIRFYERNALLPLPPRTQGGFRYIAPLIQRGHRNSERSVGQDHTARTTQLGNSSEACVYTRGSVRRASGFVQTGFGEVTGRLVGKPYLIWLRQSWPVIR
jgi:hypothetical protein